MNGHKVLLIYLQQIVKDCSERSADILKLAMTWAPGTVRSHLIQYLLQLDVEAPGMVTHSGLAMATKSVLQHAGYSKTSSLGVSIFSSIF